MSQYRFNYRERWALWKAYKGVCPYCDELLRLQDMAVDHIVPERLADYPEEFAAYRLDNHLPDEFRINDFSNWLPTHPRCNLVKGANLFASSRLQFFLTLAERHAGRARMLAERHQRTVTVDEQIAGLEQAYARGELTAFELTSALARGGLSIRIAAERLGVVVQGPGDGPTVHEAADGRLFVRMGTREVVVPSGLVTDLCGDARSNGFLRVPAELAQETPSQEETSYYIRRLRECFISALIRDSSEVIASVGVEPEPWAQRHSKLERGGWQDHVNEINAYRRIRGLEPFDPSQYLESLTRLSNEEQRQHFEDWDEQQQRRRFYSDLCRDAMEDDIAANQAIDNALRIIAMPSSWDSAWIDSHTGEGGQCLLPDALGSAIEPLLLWWRTEILQMTRPWRCVAYSARRLNDARCRAWAVPQSIFCQRHRPLLVTPVAPTIDRKSSSDGDAGKTA